jgi:phage-related protein
MKLFELLGSIVVNNREANENIDDTTKKAEDSSSKIGKAFSTMGKGIVGGAKIAGKAILGIGAAAATGVTAFLATAESTREYREELSKLTNMAKQVGTSSDYIKNKWMSMSAVLGDEGAVTEGLNNIMAAGFTTQESIDGITEVLEGAALKWKDTLKFEGLADGLQETLATGAATGPFAEMLERSGIVLDDFNAGLATCSTEAEKQDYIMKTLSETGLADVSKAYRDANGDMISAAEAQAKLTDKIAEIGAIAEPIMTTLKLVAVDLLDTIMPFVTLIGEGLQGALNGTAGAAEKLGEGLSGGIAAVLDMVVGALPTIITTISTMAPTLIQAVSDSVGQILTVISKQGPKIMGLILDVLMGLGDIIIENAPLLLDALLSIITAFTEKIPTMIPQLVQGLLTLFMGLVDHLPELITVLVTLITSLASALVEQLPVILPTLVQGVRDLILGLVDQLPTMTSAIVELHVQFWTIMGEQLPVIYPQLLDAWTQIVFALIEALPEILSPLIFALPIHLQMVWNIITGVFRGLVSWYGDLFTQAKDKIIEVFQPIEDWFGEKWQNIKDIFSDVGPWFGDKFREAWNNIESAFSNFTSFFSGLWDSIKTTFSSLGTTLGDAIGGAVKSGINSVLSMIENTINKAIGFINEAVDLINKTLGVEIGHVNILSLPRLAKGGVLYDDTAFIGGEYANAATNPEIVTPQNIMAETFDKVLTARLSLISDLQNDRLDRILALLSDYIPQLGNQKIVLDTGALVGEIVEPMDDALGERAEAKNRNRYS